MSVWKEISFTNATLCRSFFPQIHLPVFVTQVVSPWHSEPVHLKRDTIIYSNYIPACWISNTWHSLIFNHCHDILLRNFGYFFMCEPVKWLCNMATCRRKSYFFYVLNIDQDTIDLRPVKLTIIIKSVIRDLSGQCACVHGSVVSRPFVLFWSVYHDAIYSTVFAYLIRIYKWAADVQVHV